MQTAKILVVDDDADVLDLTKYQLLSEGFTEVVAVDSGERALAAAAEQSFDVVLTDLQMPDMDGLEVVERMKEVAPNAKVIMITGHGSTTKAIESMQAGAFTYLEKPVEVEKMIAEINKAYEYVQLFAEQDEKLAAQARRIKDLLKEKNEQEFFSKIIGRSKAMQNVYEIINSVADSDANVMIVGESGTGKELIANAIHDRSLRASRPFVKINCSALPKELIESELFGHTKGAFTGAASEKVGLIGQASGGSLMLDEIGEMPLELQPKLLRVLQERVYYRIGSEKALQSNFRLISATNRNPLDAMREGLLREDLYYRINTIEVHVPPLRERAEDVQLLARHFLDTYAEKYKRPARSISEEAYEAMFQYKWPGNVRELQNVIERAVLLTKGETIEASVLPFKANPVLTVVGDQKNAAQPASNGNGASPMISPLDLTFQQIGRLIIRKVPQARVGTERFDIFEEMEGAIVMAALETTRGNKQAAANLLGVYRPRLYNMLRKHNLHRPGQTNDRIDNTLESIMREL